jgi:hypothetical protein
LHTFEAMVSVYNSALVDFGCQVNLPAKQGLKLTIPIEVGVNPTTLNITFEYFTFTYCSFSIVTKDNDLVQEKELHANASKHTLSFALPQQPETLLFLKINSDNNFEVSKIELTTTQD